ncbi:MAG: hypothetical protein LM577_04045 [Thermoproteaceae archaeon]|jgi:hypothetical protein|nr:hypothetical protein [Thermoproteaceae archaeon]
MIDALVAAALGAVYALGGALIRDLRALAIFTCLAWAAAFLTALLCSMPAAVLSVAGLASAAVKIGRAKRHAIKRVLRVYKSLARLVRLEESVAGVPERILDVIPAGTVRRVHPRVVEALRAAQRAAAAGYAVELPKWARQVSWYLSVIGPELKAERALVLGEHEIVELQR